MCTAKVIYRIYLCVSHLQFSVKPATKQLHIYIWHICAYIHVYVYRLIFRSKSSGWINIFYAPQFHCHLRCHGTTSFSAVASVDASASSLQRQPRAPISESLKHQWRLSRTYVGNWSMGHARATKIKADAAVYGAARKKELKEEINWSINHRSKLYRTRRRYKRRTGIKGL